MMPPSEPEHRLHPIALLLLIGRQLKELGFGLVAFVVISRTSGGSPGAIGQAVGPLVVLVILLGPSLAKLLSFRYRYGPDELVIRWGWLFRKERHIPFARIQSVDARELLPHRWTGTVAVKIETGGGHETDGDIAAIPRADYLAMRERVLGGAAALGLQESTNTDPHEQSLVRLSPRELLLAGWILNRGMVVVGGAVALLFELGVSERILEHFFGAEVAERGTFSNIGAVLSGGIPITPGGAAIAAGVVLAFLVLVRLLSMGLSVIRFHNHHLTRVGDDLRVSCGLFTRTTSTTPVRRIQTLTVREGPWHRLAGRVTVQVTTAGGSLFETAVASRETLAPLVTPELAESLILNALEGVAPPREGWRVAAPPTRGRAARRLALLWVPLCLLAWLVGTPAVILAVSCALMHLMASWGRIARFRWLDFDGGVALRTGWLWRRTTVARHNRIQAAVWSESPFDRRLGMAEVSVDTAGHDAPPMHFTALSRADADGLAARIQSAVAATEFSI